MPSCLGPRSSQLYVKGGKSTVIQWMNEDHQRGSCIMDTLSDYFFFWITYSSVLDFHFVKLILMHACLLLTSFAYFLPILSLSPFCAVWYIYCWFFSSFHPITLVHPHGIDECWNMNKISENCEWFQVSGIKAFLQQILLIFEMFEASNLWVEVLWSITSLIEVSMWKLSCKFSVGWIFAGIFRSCWQKGKSWVLLCKFCPTAVAC